MAATVSVVFPIFAIILAGWLARRFGIVEAAGLRGLREVVFRLAMPALLFSSMVQAPPVDLALVAIVYFSACLVIFALGVGLGRALGLPLARAAMLGLNSSYGNTVMVGIPLALAAFGPAALPSLLAIIALHSAVLLPLAGMLMEAEAEAAGRRSALAVAAGILKGAAQNPVIVAILAAFLWRATGIALPGPLLDTLKLLGSAGIPLALIVLGGSLPPLERSALGPETLVTLVLKLLALPALVWVFGILMDLPSLPLGVAVLTAAMPTGANAFLLAHRNDDLVAVSAGAVLVSTVLSVGTLCGLLAILG